MQEKSASGMLQSLIEKGFQLYLRHVPGEEEEKSSLHNLPPIWGNGNVEID